MTTENKLSRADEIAKPYVIAIPSFRRVDTLMKKTLAMLERHKIDPSIVTIFVADQGEWIDYHMALTGNTPYDQNIVIGVPKIGPQRNHIERAYPEGTHLVMIDDDLEEVEVATWPSTFGPIDDLDKFFRESFCYARKKGAGLWGLYSARNTFFMNYKHQTNLCYIIGCLFGVICAHDEELARVTDHGEDYEYSIRRYIRDGAVSRANFVTCRTNYYKEPGGLQEFRTPEYLEDGINKIVELFPDHCKKYIRQSTGHPELRLRHTKKSD